MKKPLSTLLLLLLFANFVQAADVPQEEILFIKKHFNTIQQRTFDANREYCGYLGFDKNDNYIVTKAIKGDENSCYVKDIPEDIDIVASYHTHGAFSVEADSEVPSPEDMKADMSEQVDGYIATPGGRIWFSDSQKGTITMICGKGCVKSDPKFDGSQLDPVKKHYTLKTLLRRFEDQ